MPYTTHWTPQTITWTYTGKLTGDELIQSNMEVYGDPRFDDIRYQIVDLRAITQNLVEDSHMRTIAHLDMAAARSNPRIKIAVIANNSKGMEMSDTYINHTGHKSPWITKTFLTIEQANEWLGIKR